MVEKRKEGENGVMMSLYVESRKLRTDHIKRINSVRLSSRPRVFRTRGYDRHAHLLTYAQGLRRVDAKQLKRPFKNPRWKSKSVWIIEQRILYRSGDGPSWKGLDACFRDFMEPTGNASINQLLKENGAMAEQENLIFVYEDYASFV
ncbi:hypothetical protein C2S53_012050 [Perilla frutescens var. hirtella]|uniref:Uncharacterized protein n=1 Tax=Perilla frutescens var. hirtella TaxID=608512 RepID=A0AAD4PEK7_PERFH|nr:hypothetical protein C2S53_012050 [Perilla frutescens var. hirtella]